MHTFFHKLFLCFFSAPVKNMNPKATEIIKKDFIITAKKKDIKEPHKMSTKKLLDTFNRYEKNVSRTIFVEDLTD